MPRVQLDAPWQRPRAWAGEYAEMVRSRPALHGADLPGTGHDVHLERRGHSTG
ncbi:hypothetical protein [Streptomyces zaomyceticus]|uniref:hypothetical protein n=1 Tax=Streptomyces zaomyceticus TaxID=68286 RepID=UPI0034394BBC